MILDDQSLGYCLCGLGKFSSCIFQTSLLLPRDSWPMHREGCTRVYSYSIFFNKYHCSSIVLVLHSQIQPSWTSVDWIGESRMYRGKGQEFWLSERVLKASPPTYPGNQGKTLVKPGGNWKLYTGFWLQGYGEIRCPHPQIACLNRTSNHLSVLGLFALPLPLLNILKHLEDKDCACPMPETPLSTVPDPVLHQGKC